MYAVSHIMIGVCTLLYTISSTAVWLRINILVVDAFTLPSSSVMQQQRQRHHDHCYYSKVASAAATTTTTTKTLQLHASTQSALQLPNPLKKLPWNVAKERQREMFRNQLERSKIYRQIGIAEDATYEEIVSVTDQKIAQAERAKNIKLKIQIEIMKDQILQHRLNERLNGLLLQEKLANKEARAMSNYELEGIDEDDMPKAAKEWNAPLWTKGLIVKPDSQQIQSQVRLWGIVTLLGVALPPVQDYLGRFTWLICIAQLTFRGMPKSEMEGSGGMGAMAAYGRGGSHRKVAFGLGFATWVVGAVIAYGLMPSWARGQRWTNSMAFTIQNVIFGLASCYLQPYKG